MTFFLNENKNDRLKEVQITGKFHVSSEKETKFSPLNDFMEQKWYQLRDGCYTWCKRWAMIFRTLPSSYLDLDLKKFYFHLVPTVRFRFLDSWRDCIIVVCLRAKVFTLRINLKKRKYVIFFHNKKQNLSRWRTCWAWICLKEEKFRQLILFFRLIGLFLLRFQHCAVLGDRRGESAWKPQNWRWIQAPLAFAPSTVGSHGLLDSASSMLIKITIQMKTFQLLELKETGNLVSRWKVTNWWTP